MVLSSSSWPGESLPAYCAALAAVMENSGFSAAYGSARTLLGDQPAGAFISPPLQAGMLPSLLPAFSAPIGVRSWPRRAICASVAAARAAPLDRVESRADR